MTRFNTTTNKMPVPSTPKTQINQSTRKTLNSFGQKLVTPSLDTSSFLKISMAASLNHEKTNKKVAPPSKNKIEFDKIIVFTVYL